MIKKCSCCNKEGKYIGTDIRLVFPEERLLIESLLGEEFKYSNHSVWNTSGNNLVNKNDNDIKVLQKKVLDYSYDFDLKYDILLSPIVESTENYNNRIKYMTFYKKIQEEGVLLSV